VSSQAAHSLSYLDELEAQSIYILREVVAQFEKPVLLYSVGKDSSVLIRLAQKAFRGKVPFQLLHVDTTFEFEEVYAFRDWFVKEIGAELIVDKNEEAVAQGANPYDLGTQRCCGVLRTEALLKALRRGGYDAAIGGARRDEERSRAKERVFSFRDKFGQWDPRNQRPELWNQYNGRVAPGESIRVFPLSDWTEIDVWRYIAKEQIPIVPLYFAMEREVVIRGDQVIPLQASSKLLPGEKAERALCRFRSLGCTPCTGAIRSTARTVPEIVEEMLTVRTSERAGRVIDHDTDGSMELKKREGYF
jgi:sulfate adenylyltransferase subunit 2